jgi:anaerobic dimethyl sulfoxide reductase subunit B
MMVCPVKAIWRRAEDGTVQIDRAKCVGCRQCAAFCPYQAPQWNSRTMKMEKCTMCFDRIESGLEPACSTICPTGALQFGEWPEVQKKGTDRIENFANPAQTRPKVRFDVSPFPGGK